MLQLQLLIGDLQTGIHNERNTAGRKETPASLGWRHISTISAQPLWQGHATDETALLHLFGV